MIRKLVQRLRLRTRQGFSLLEVLIGMVILAIGLASAFVLGINNAKLIENNQNIAAASSLAEYKLEEMRNASFVSIVDGSDGPLTSSGDNDANGLFARAWTVQSGAPSFSSSDLKTVVVSVAWSQLGQDQTYSLTGVIKR